jgi:hypothetical protein
MGEIEWLVEEEDTDSLPDMQHQNELDSTFMENVPFLTKRTHFI